MDEERDEPIANQEEYSLMLVLDRLESLREDLEEVGFSTLREIEAALALTVPTNPDNPDPVLDERRSLLTEIRSEMLDLNVDTLREVQDQIRILHEQLDQEDF